MIKQVAVDTRRTCNKQKLTSVKSDYKEKRQLIRNDCINNSIEKNDIMI